MSYLVVKGAIVPCGEIILNNQKRLVSPCVERSDSGARCLRPERQEALNDQKHLVSPCVERSGSGARSLIASSQRLGAFCVERSGRSGSGARSHERQWCKKPSTIRSALCRVVRLVSPCVERSDSDARSVSPERQWCKKPKPYVTPRVP